MAQEHIFEDEHAIDPDTGEKKKNWNSVNYMVFKAGKKLNAKRKKMR